MSRRSRIECAFYLGTEVKSSISQAMDLGKWAASIPDGYFIGDRPLDCDSADSLSAKDFPRLEKEAKRNVKPIKEEEAEAYRWLRAQGTLGPDNTSVPWNLYHTYGTHEVSEDGEGSPDWIRVPAGFTAGWESPLAYWGKYSFASPLDLNRREIETQAMFDAELANRKAEKSKSLTNSDIRGFKLKSKAAKRDFEASKILAWVAKASPRLLANKKVRDTFWARLKESRENCAAREDWSEVWLTKGQVDEIWLAWKGRLGWK